MAAVCRGVVDVVCHLLNGPIEPFGKFGLIFDNASGDVLVGVGSESVSSLDNRSILDLAFVATCLFAPDAYVAAVARAAIAARTILPEENLVVCATALGAASCSHASAFPSGLAGAGPDDAAALHSRTTPSRF